MNVIVTETHQQRLAELIERWTRDLDKCRREGWHGDRRELEHRLFGVEMVANLLGLADLARQAEAAWNEERPS